ncbi:MAG: hypothetical protein ACI9R3_001304 [Verrucomicrobiales bacterium]|jgi:hypothetical protein
MTDVNVTLSLIGENFKPSRRQKRAGRNSATALTADVFSISSTSDSNMCHHFHKVSSAVDHRPDHHFCPFCPMSRSRAPDFEGIGRAKSCHQPRDLSDCANR